MQRHSDLVPVFQAIQSLLAEKGLFLGVMIGGESLAELREILYETEIAMTGRAHARFVPLQSGETIARAMMESGFADPVVDRERITLTYKDMFALINDLRESGCANALSERPRAIPPKKLFEQAAALYQSRFSLPQGGVQATLDLFFIHGWREG